MGPGQKSDPSKKKQVSGGAGTDTPEDEVRGENTAAYMCVRHKVWLRLCCQIMFMNNIATIHFLSRIPRYTYMLLYEPSLTKVYHGISEINALLDAYSHFILQSIYPIK